jgi:2-polyprenyl-3-methyl-5-hydroxy-6-metoxy-1,4-benzoquinol methylase
MATSLYPQSGVVRRAQSVAPPARRSDSQSPRMSRSTPPPRTGKDISDGMSGTLPLYSCAAAELGPRSRVIDLGCGDGFGAEWLTRHYSDVVAVDNSSAAASAARRNAPGAEVRCGEVAELAKLGSIDGAVVIDLLGYVRAPEDLLAALHQTISSDARVFIAEPHAYAAQCLVFPVRRTYSHRSLTTLLTMSGYEVARWVDGHTAFVSCVANPELDGTAQWLSQGYLQLAADSPDEALSSFERAEGSPRKSVQLEAAIGEAECFLSQRKRGAAIDAFLRARDLCPEDARPLAGLARIALGRGELADAVELARVAYRVDPTDVAAACAQAMVAEKTAPTEAKERWVRAANLAPESFDIALRLAHSAAAEQDYAIALWALQRVRTYGQDHGVPMHVAIATALLGTGRIGEALSEARRAESMAPNDESVRALLSALR